MEAIHRISALISYGTRVERRSHYLRNCNFRLRFSLALDPNELDGPGAVINIERPVRGASIADLPPLTRVSFQLHGYEESASPRCSVCMEFNSSFALERSKKRHYKATEKKNFFFTNKHAPFRSETIPSSCC